ncbi:MAG: radical SAM protein [Cyanobacteriota bacterium]
MSYVPEVAVWEVTFKCNVNCIHCGSDCETDTRPDELTTSEALDLVDQLADMGCKLVTMSGGEPFLRKDWAIIAHKIRQRCMDLTFVTNGCLITPDKVAILQKLKPRSTAISLDAGEAFLHDYIRGQQGCFNRALQSLDMLLNAGLYTSIVTSLQRINFHQLEKIKQIVLLYGIDAWQIQVATPQGRMKKEFAITEAQFYEAAKFIVATDKRFKRLYVTGADCFGYFGNLDPFLHPMGWEGCHAGTRCIGIESNGNIKGCLSLPGERFVEGNIREKPLKEIWAQKGAFPYNRRFEKDMLTGYCHQCLFSDICRGGCTERAYGFASEYCENPLCTHKIEQKGYSNAEQASLNPDPEGTDLAYHNVKPLPEGFSLKTIPAIITY